ncbi:MAG: hypothetical protein QF551_02570 [Candidatus Marinimicrobia bacterium]|nr:hypothetical protein [Candidatus Neomarinimicrobiota bacterium]MDP6835582.1 hypothetical protein [Candidatus Neomarinimicrobiota bacterium]MDP6966140.1 hypothetical protein [Candidatus Neomarinimicrobiota bacterium]
MKISGKNILLVLPLLLLTLEAQSVKLLPQPGFVPYATYYLSSIDIKTGSSDVMFFGYLLSEENGDYESREVWAKIEFEVSMLSAALGVTERMTVIKVETAPFRMYADLRLDNRQLSIETTSLFDLDSPPNEIPLAVRVLDQMDIAKFESLLSSVVTTGKLADGQYSFHLVLKSGSSDDEGSLTLSDEMSETVLVTSPTSLNLIGPGGVLADTSMNMNYSLYPIFQWETDPCPGCESLIRIGQFKSDSHSSAEEAIEDLTVLPMDQTQEWESTGIATSFQYPFSGAIDLVPGEVYVWQVQKRLPTTAGSEAFTSPIFAFKMADSSEPPTTGTEALHPIVQQLMEIMGEQQFNAYFGPDAELGGFSPSGTYEINGMEVSVDAVFTLLNEIRNQSVSIISISVE